MKPIHVGLLGIGTVGGGTFDVLSRNAEEIQRRAGRGIASRMVADMDARSARKEIAGGKARRSPTTPQRGARDRTSTSSSS